VFDPFIDTAWNQQTVGIFTAGHCDNQPRIPFMSGRNGLTLLLTDRNIRTKVSLGFVCVLAILAVVSGMAYIAFQSAAVGFASYTQRVTVVDIARNVDRNFLNLRRIVREYAFTGVETNVTEANREEAALHVVLVQGLNEIRNPDRRRRLQEVSDLTDRYIADFNKVVADTRQEAELQKTGLIPLGLAQRQHFAALIAAGSAGDSHLMTLAYKGLDQWMVMRFTASRAIFQHDKAAAADVETQFAALDTTLRELDTATKGTNSGSVFDSLRTGLPAYRDAYHRFIALQAEVSGLIDGTMFEIAAKVQANTEAIRNSGVAEQAQTQKATLATMDQTGTMVLGLAIGGVLLGCVLAWLIGRGIAGPVIGLCNAMSALAAGDKTVAVPGVPRGDEIGTMARSVDVFKRDMIEMDRLRDEQESQKSAAQAERKAALRQLAAGFEAQVGGVIQSVGSATSQLQAASKLMQDNAARASAEATSVASASAQSATNAQAVAGASDQLTASISEIAKQVESARAIATRADAEATQTTDLVQKLSQTVNAIGAIVALINDVASQTNLLALNATIEAARAGESGRGFAVVASEVKNLASQTARATEEIASKIGAVQAGTEDAAKAIASITRVMSQMSTISASIAAAVEQQSSATAEIARNVEQAASGTREVSERIAKVDIAARETGTAANEINGSANELQAQTETLRTEVRRFLEQVRSDREVVRILTWDDAWNVGVPAIDRHHRGFLDGLNRLFGHLMQGDGREAVPHMAQLVATTIEPHFAEEEALMRRHNYRDLATHQAAHKTFVSRFHEVSQTLEAGRAVDAAGFFDFVAGWFKEHMRDHDAPLAQYLKVKQAA
jgi:hemerythrin-like metal-binding protein